MKVKTIYGNELYHFGILGQKWGIRRYQNPDGTLTEEGKDRYKVEKEDLRKNFYKKVTSEKILKTSNWEKVKDTSTKTEVLADKLYKYEENADKNMSDSDYEKINKWYEEAYSSSDLPRNLNSLEAYLYKNDETFKKMYDEREISNKERNNSVRNLTEELINKVSKHSINELGLSISDYYNCENIVRRLLFDMTADDYVQSIAREE